MTKRNLGKEPSSGCEAKEMQDPTEEDQAQKEGMWEKTTKGHTGKE